MNMKIDNSDFCNEENLLFITRTLDTLLKITKQLKGAESIANYCRSYQRDATTSHTTSKVELQHLHDYFLTEIIYPFDYRISRISVLLRSNTEILLEPSFLQGLKNSVETACILLERGAEAYEEDKLELEKEYARIIESDRLIEMERIRKIKDDNRKLLETKISLLKSRQRELEEEKNQNEKKLKADNETKRKDEEMRMSEVEKTVDDVVRKEEKCENVNFSSDVDVNFFESKYDSRAGREKRGKHQKRSRDQHEDEDEERDIEIDVEGCSTYCMDVKKKFGDRTHRHSEDCWRKMLESGEVHRGDFIYSLQRPKWDIKKEDVSTAPSNDEMSGRTLQSAFRLSSVVGCTDFARTDDEEGIISSSRRRKSERNQDQVEYHIPDLSQNEELFLPISISTSSSSFSSKKSESEQLLSSNSVFADESERRNENIDVDNYFEKRLSCDKEFESSSITDNNPPESVTSTTVTITNIVKNQKKNENHIREALLASRLKKKMLKL